VEAADRKLIRPPLGASKDRAPRRRPVAQALPAEATNAENFYYAKQIQQKTPMVIVLRDGEKIHGVLEWYDRTCLRLQRGADPPAVIYKTSIKYIYKDESGD
jgi:sRNA-binding regulator protein Hfq